MRVILGGRYEAGDGHVVHIVDCRPDPIFPFVGDDERRYTARGEFIPEQDCHKFKNFSVLVERFNLKEEVLYV